MVGAKSRPPSRPVTRHSTDKQNPPSYSDLENEQSQASQAYMTATTTTTVTTTTQTTTFFSLPLWRRRTGPPMTFPAKSEGSHASALQAGATEDGRIVRASSYNIDYNKSLPDIPPSEELADPTFARRSTGMMYLPTIQQGSESGAKCARSSRSSTLLPPHAQSTRTLAQAGLGIGLPHVMPLAASTARKASQQPARPNTAPRPARLGPNQEVRRVKSFSRFQAEPGTSVPTVGDQGSSVQRKKSTMLNVPAGDNSDRRISGEVAFAPSPSTRPESKSLTKRASFWNRRRVQSLRGSDETRSNGQQDAGFAPPLPLPAFEPISPMFPERPVQSSPVRSPRSSGFQQHSRLRRRHSDRSTSAHHSPSCDSSFSGDSPPIPPRSPGHPPLTEASPRTAANGSASSIRAPQPPPVQNSFITSPGISRLIDQRQSRPRSMTSPNVLQRLSMGFFTSSSPSTPISSPSVSTHFMDENNICSSPRESRAFTRDSFSKSAVEVPKPRTDEESPEVFLGRLEAAVSKAEIANILAGSGDVFYSAALKAYIDRFDFRNDPLDIALRKLLMDVGLPKETQQIDRVIEAFAARYVACNPNLFVSQDHPYILAFSLIMLHTDAFNKSNKRKMTKTDYIKNTKLVGVSAEVLDYFFDNIVFAPFIFIEDPIDVNGQHGFNQDSKSPASGSGQATPTLSESGRSVLGKSNKVDAYYLITRNLLHGLRVDVESFIPLRNPFSYQGTAGSWNEAELRRSFARAEMIDVGIIDPRKSSTLPFFTVNAGGASTALVNDVVPSVKSEQESVLLEYSALRVTKVGLLNRKDDLLDGGKRATNRKWKEVSVILTGSQLLFYRDSALALNLIVQSHSPDSATFPAQSSFLRPDELLSVKDAIAVYDSSYGKRDYVVRLVMSSGRQILLQTENEMQRNEWIAHINYASAFKTAGIRMRPVSATENARMDRCSYTRDAPLIPSEPSTSTPDLLLENSIDSNPIASTGASDADSGQGSQGRSADFATNTHSRSRIVLGKIREFEAKIEAARAQLESNIRFVHNLAILTPFQRSTRDRLQTAVINLSRHVRQLRLEIVKATCFRDVLAADLASEQREEKCRRQEDIRQRGVQDYMKVHVPSVSLSVHEEGDFSNVQGQSLSRSDISELSHGQRDSSICESFHSALDFGADWPRNSRPHVSLQKDSPTMQSLETVSPICTPCHEVPPGSPNGSGFFASPSAVTPSVNISSPHNGAEGGSSAGQRISEEQAEEWDKTRAARRVSLVKVPAILKATDKTERRTNPPLTEPR